MKLSDLEQALTAGKCTPELLEQFKTALRRSPKSMRPQHCYTTAAAMPAKCFPQAKELIEYSLTLEGTWTDRMRAHANLADLYEKRSDYGNAKIHHQLALDAVDPGQQERYTADSAARMLVCQLHLDNFACSDELRRLYVGARKLDTFTRSFLKCDFYLTLARLVLSLDSSDHSTARTALDHANELLRPGHEGPLTALLRCKNYIESTGATKEARAFLKQVEKRLR